MRPPRLRCTLFPLIYPPHLLVLPATLGLHLFWQTYPYFRALYVISVRRTKSLLTASFRFHLTMDTLAVLLYTSSLPRRVRDFHPLERTHGAQTKKSPQPKPERHLFSILNYLKHLLRHRFLFLLFNLRLRFPKLFHSFQFFLCIIESDMRVHIHCDRYSHSVTRFIMNRIPPVPSFVSK